MKPTFRFFSFDPSSVQPSSVQQFRKTQAGTSSFRSASSTVIENCSVVCELTNSDFESFFSVERVRLMMYRLSQHMLRSFTGEFLEYSCLFQEEWVVKILIKDFIA